MSWVNSYGEPIETPRGHEESHSVDKVRAVLMRALNDAGTPERQIAEIFFTSKTTVNRSIQSVSSSAFCVEALRRLANASAAAVALASGEGA